MFTFKFHSFFILFVACVFSTNAITKESLVKQAEKNSNPLKIGISANFTTKTSIQNNTMSDSGVYFFSPPNRTRIDFHSSKIVLCSSGDTTWSKAPTGDITRSIKSGLGLPGNPNGTPSISTPNLLSYLKSGNFSIVSEDSISIVVKADIEYDKQKIPFTFYIDPKTFIIKRMEFPSPMGGMFQIGYKYQLFKGYLVLDEVNTIMGSIGFTRVHLFNYQTSKKSRSFFRLF